MSPAPAHDILLVVGSDQAVEEAGDQVRIRGLTDLNRLLGSEPRLPILQLTRQFADEPRDLDLSRLRCVVNLITEPEVNRQVLGILADLLDSWAGKVVNHPNAVLGCTRDEVARSLDGTAGLHVPKVARFQPDAEIDHLLTGMRFPLLLRAAGTHTGKFVGRFDSAEELRGALPATGDHLLTEFVDFRSADGLYRKYRVFWIGERMVLRHMLVAEEWNVHARTRVEFMADRPDLIAEEGALFAQPSGTFPPAVRETLAAVRGRMPLDFFGMDFAILDDGRMLLFEANATMNFFPFVRDQRFAYLLRAIDPAQQAMFELVGLPSRPGGIVMGDAIGQMGA